MPNIKSHISTSIDGLRRKSVNPYNKPTETSYDQSYFPLKPTRFPLGTPATSVRSKKVYSDLLDERTFLLELREQWVQKLQDLKEDHKFLSKMKSVKKNEVLGIEPLFEKESTPPLSSFSPTLYPIPSNHIISQPSASSLNISQPLSPNHIISQPSASYFNISQPILPNQPIELEYLVPDSELAPDNEIVTINEPDILNAFEELEGLYSDEEEEEEDGEEDEERARIALNLMLQEFGNSI